MSPKSRKKNVVVVRVRCLGKHPRSSRQSSQNLFQTERPASTSRDKSTPAPYIQPIVSHDTMPRTFGGARPSLRQQLDRDVLQIVQKLADGLEPGRLPRIDDVFNAIKSSNSSLARKPRKSLEDSIERVLDVMREDMQQDDDDEIDDLGPVEGEFDGLGLENSTVPEPKHTLNNSLTKMYAAQTGANGSKVS